MILILDLGPCLGLQKDPLCIQGSITMHPLVLG